MDILRNLKWSFKCVRTSPLVAENALSWYNLSCFNKACSTHNMSLCETSNRPLCLRPLTQKLVSRNTTGPFLYHRFIAARNRRDMPVLLTE